jgi:hypothetical protein
MSKKLSNGMKIVFAPGCFDEFEGTQEELDELMAEIEKTFSDDSFLENIKPVDLDDGSWTQEEIEELENKIKNNDMRRLN